MKEDEKQMQEKYIEFQMLQQQAEQLGKYMEELDLKLKEFTQTKENLQNLGETQVNTETLVSLAPGIFGKAEIKENKKFIINVGANIMVEKTVPQITEMIDRQITEISQAQMKMDQDMQAIHKKIDQIVKDLQAS